MPHIGLLGLHVQFELDHLGKPGRPEARNEHSALLHHALMFSRTAVDATRDEPRASLYDAKEQERNGP
jgi:hypothetical protein